MPNPLSQDILSSADAVERARSAIRRYNANQRYLDALRSRAPEIGRPDPMKLEAPPELDPDQVVADVMFGKGTGSLAKDILLGFTGGFAGPATEAMGGQSGVLDWVPGGGLLKGGAMGIVAGAKNLSKKIHKPVANFIRRTAGEEGLELVDQYVKRYPKVDNLSMSDAYELLSSGRLGKEFVIDFAKEYPAEKVMSVLDNGTTGNLTRVLESIEKVGADFDPEKVAKTKVIVEGALDKLSQAMQSGDYLTANYISRQMLTSLLFARDSYAKNPALHKGGLGAFIDIVSDPTNAKNFNFAPEVVRKETEATMKKTDGRFFRLKDNEDAAEATMANEYLTMQVDKLQDFDKIEAQQAAKDAKQSAKAAKKQPAPASIPEPVVAQPEPVPQAARVMDIAEPAVEEAPAAVGGPNKWRENGWRSEEHPLSGGSYESLVGKGANEEDRRAAFVLDSLMNDAVAGLYRNKAMWWKKTNGDIGFAKSGNHELKPGEVKLDYGGDWNDFRHKAYNYDQQRLKLSRDLRENLATGNMPKSSRVILEDAYNMRTGNRIPGASRARVNGMDTYEWLFRPMVTEKILKDTPEYMGGFKK